MEFKICKEIRDYYEKFIIGFSLRELISVILGAITALIVGFNLRGKVSTMDLATIIPLCVVPFIIVGFGKFNGMRPEKFIVAWFRDVFLFPQKLTIKNDNEYKLMLALKEKGGFNEIVKRVKVKIKKSGHNSDS